HRKPMPAPPSDGVYPAFTAKTPAATPALKSPPRRNIPGRDEAPDPPKQLLSPPGRAAELVQSVQLESETSPQSATISSTFPTMSKTPHAALHFDRDPVLTGSGELTAQSVIPVVRARVRRAGCRALPLAVRQ